MMLPLSSNVSSNQQIVTVNFLDTVNPYSAKTLVSQRISRPFRLLLIRPHFALGANRLLRLYFYLSIDDSTPSSLPLSGSNVIQETSQEVYVVGDNESKELYQNFVADYAGSYLKVFADNKDAFKHTIDVQMFYQYLN